MWEKSLFLHSSSRYKLWKFTAWWMRKDKLLMATWKESMSRCLSSQSGIRATILIPWDIHGRLLKWRKSKKWNSLFDRFLWMGSSLLFLCIYFYPFIFCSFIFINWYEIFYEKEYLTKNYQFLRLHRKKNQLSLLGWSMRLPKSTLALISNTSGFLIYLSSFVEIDFSFLFGMNYRIFGRKFDVRWTLCFFYAPFPLNTPKGERPVCFGSCLRMLFLAWFIDRINWVKLSKSPILSPSNALMLASWISSTSSTNLVNRSFKFLTSHVKKSSKINSSVTVLSSVSSTLHQISEK